MFKLLVIGAIFAGFYFLAMRKKMKLDVELEMEPTRGREAPGM